MDKEINISCTTICKRKRDVAVKMSLEPRIDVGSAMRDFGVIGEDVLGF